jgi:hypothetical protein
MRFGLFGGAQADSADPAARPGEGFRDYIDFNIEAGALGYHSARQACDSRLPEALKEFIMGGFNTTAA